MSTIGNTIALFQYVHQYTSVLHLAVVVFKHSLRVGIAKV